MTQLDPNMFLAPVIIAGICAGVLMVGIVLFITIYWSSGEKLHLAILLIAISGLVFVAAEMGMATGHLLDNPSVGRQLHRVQGLVTLSFLFCVPYFLNNMVDLSIVWKQFNRYLPAVGLVICLCIGALAFIAPDLFISQNEPRGIVLNLRWGTMRGEAGILYRARDIAISLIMLYTLVCMVFDIAVHRRFRYLAFPVAGGMIFILLGYYEYLIVYRLIDERYYLHGNYCYTIVGITVFISLSMAGILRMFVDQARSVEKAMKIESLGIFAGGIAHDFNNLLTAIIGNISLARLSCNNNNGGDVVELLSETEKAADRARELTRQLLTFSSGGAPVRNVTSIRDILIDTAHFITSGSLVCCEFNIADNLKNADVDRGQISQMIQNIILNGIQSMPGGGTIYISAENVRLKRGRPIPESRGDWIKITIRDSGTGIPKKYIERIFDPYFTTKNLGNGLGLTISYSIVKKHNGHISVRSREGEGTTFDIYLPASDRMELPSSVGAPGEPAGGGTVIIMDDETLILDVGERMLRKIGFGVRRARDGAEALSAYRELVEAGVTVSCVIMDLSVPGGMGGKDAARELKKKYPESRIIASSGYSNDPVMARFGAYGFDAIIVKPYRIDDLKESIARALKK
ncbi:MAG: response regulator [Spirochaetes bacterium]|nr:response regulator [Spirochaetota bacterium]